MKDLTLEQMNEIVKQHITKVELKYEEKLLTIGNVKQFRTRAEYFYNLVKSFEEQGNTIYDFVDYLDRLVDLNNPTVTIYVSNKKENYDYLSKYIKTKKNTFVKVFSNPP